MSQKQVERPQRHHLSFFLLLLAILLLLTACLGGGDDNAEAPAAEAESVPALLSGNVQLQCTAQCAARGQCGTAVDNNQLIFGGKAGPAVENHDVLFPANTPAIVQSTQVKSAEEISTAAHFDINFYQIALADGSQSGWVTEWCVRPQ